MRTIFRVSGGDSLKTKCLDIVNIIRLMLLCSGKSLLILRLILKTPIYRVSKMRSFVH